MTIYKPLWEYISLNDYAIPSPPTGTVLQNNLKSMWRHLSPYSVKLRFQQRQMRTIPAYLLNRAAKTPDLNSVTAALMAALQQRWAEKKDESTFVQVVVGPPGSQMDRVVNSLAKQSGWKILGPPSTSEILSGGKTWLENLDLLENAPLVIPRLEKCFLRHQDGLTLLDRLLDKLQESRRHYLIACDSWAWAYLEKTLHVGAMLSEPLTLAPLDGNKLQFWLPTLARTSKGQFAFRDSSNGQLIFPVTTNYEDQLLINARPGQMEFYADWVGGGGFLKQLTAYCRGIHQLVWLIWRECLQIRSNGNVDLSRLFVNGEDWFTVWVKPLSDLVLPEIPPFSGNVFPMVLHTLLLHNGASIDLLDFLLPFSDNELRHAIAILSKAGLVCFDENKTYRVTLLGYPAVRRFIHNEGYLVDAF
jgi:predicted transcriptional regulator